MPEVSASWGEIEVAPRIAPVKYQSPEVQPLTAEEAERAIAAIEPRFQAMFRLAFNTGLRRGELAALEWRDFGPKKRQLRGERFVDSRT